MRGCSGFYFRVEETGEQVAVAGFQAEVEPTFETGGLYETGGRGWVVKPDPEFIRSIYHPGESTVPPGASRPAGHRRPPRPLGCGL